MKKALLIFSCYMITILQQVNAWDPTVMHGTFSFGAAIPNNEFKDNTTSTGLGVNFHFYIPFTKEIPLYFGFGLGYYLFGSSTQNLHEDVEVKAGNTVISTIPIDLAVTTNNNLSDGFACIRYKAPFDYVQPYVEIKGGFNYLYTRTKVLDNTEKKLFTSGKEDNEINSRTVSSGFTWCYGMEAGFIVKPWKSIGINLGLDYLYGGITKYYDKSQVQQWTVSFSGTSGTFNPTNPDPNTLNLSSDAGTPRRSYTDMMIVNLGVTFYFPEGGKAIKVGK
jgi:hypothetical protein